MAVRNSIKRKIIFAIMLTSIAVLLVTILAFMVFDLFETRKNLVLSLEMQAQMFAENSTAALAFKNNSDAAEILSSSDANPHIIAVALYDADGNLFAKFPTNAPASDLPVKLRSSGYEFHQWHVAIFMPVIQSQSRLGTVYLSSDLGMLGTRFRLYGGISLVIAAGSLLVAFWLSSQLQKLISQPIVALAKTARRVSEKHDYSVRAPKTTNDELGYLTDAFNSMLAQIQSSDSELRRGRERLQIVADHAFIFLCQINPFHRLTFVNRTFAERYNTVPEKIIGKHISDVTGVEAYRTILKWLEKAFAGERVEFETEIAYETLGPRWIHAIYVPEIDPAGNVNNVVAVISDITERKQAERELERTRDEAMAASHAKDEFLAALSHELRTPLNPVLLMASDGASNPDFSPDVRRMFESIDKNVSLEARLIDDLLDLTRITRNKLSLDLKEVDAHAILKNAIEIIYPDAEQKQIRLIQKFVAASFTVLGDSTRLQQIFWNILKNAIKFTPSKGDIFIKTWDENARLFIEIRDTGIGLTEQELQRIFDAFVQGDHATTTHRFGGLGLGLAISQRLVEMHFGTIRAASRGRGQGAQFIIELPLVSANENKSMDAAGQPFAKDG